MNRRQWEIDLDEALEREEATFALILERERNMRRAAVDVAIDARRDGPFHLDADGYAVGVRR